MTDNTPGLARPDDVYAALLDAHDGLDEACSRRLDAGLVIRLATMVGDDDAVIDTIRSARAALDPGSTEKRD